MTITQKLQKIQKYSGKTQEEWVTQNMNTRVFKNEGVSFDFKLVDGKLLGPYGLLAIILSLFIPFSIAMFFSIAYNRKTKELIKARDESKQLEDEFASNPDYYGQPIDHGYLQPNLPNRQAVDALEQVSGGKLSPSPLSRTVLVFREDSLSTNKDRRTYLIGNADVARKLGE